MKIFFSFKNVTAAFLMFFIACNSSDTSSDKAWTAPESASSLKSPFTITADVELKGQQLYMLYCWQCHGVSGFGDGAAGSSLEQKPANFHDRRIRKEPDGALFWKMSTGKGTMPAFKDVLSDEERWSLVAYIRKLSTNTAVSKMPKALRPDITVAYVMKTAPHSVRIFQNPVSKEIWYTTFEGDVYRIKNVESKEPASQKILSLKDHGITQLQGAVFLGNSLFLCGNVPDTNHKTTKGRMVRVYFNDTAVSQIKVVFNTVDYPANKTIYDHGWNALELSADEKYIYANSGARTDHGEVQDFGGLFPNQRDNILTSKIFRFPVETENLVLSLDTAQVQPYLFASGIRNAYDMAIDDKGNLFAVSNSCDYDMSEDMFWVREGHHYGFPWVMGGLENPQQFPDWKPDPETDKFINKSSHSWEVKYFHNDPTFPRIPAGVKFSPGVQNIGPDANMYRGHTGKILDGDQTGVTISTFTAHSCPLGLFFDKKKILSNDLKGDGFVIRYSLGATSSLMHSFEAGGSDLLHLHLMYDSLTDNYFVRTTKIVDDFDQPTDAILVGNEVYVIGYGESNGNIWKITLPANNTKQSVSKNK
jgi:glucose/arabinose dehydrogenase